MDDDDPNGYAQLWLSELGAHVPEHYTETYGDALPAGYGLDRSPAERAHRFGARLAREPRTARAYRARSDRTT